MLIPCMGSLGSRRAPRTSIADPLRNADSIVDIARRCSDAGAGGVVAGAGAHRYAINDLLGQDALLDSVHDGLDVIVRASTGLLPVIVVGAPLRHRGGWSTPR